MRRTLMIGIVVSCMAGILGDGAPSAVRPVSAETRDGWPDTRAGALARRWVEAFSKGEKAMRETLPEILTPEGLAKTPMDERMERYRDSHERYGSLMLVKIQKSTHGELVAVLAASDLTQRPFTFKVQTQPPYKLISVSAQEQRHMMHGGFSH